MTFSRSHILRAAAICAVVFIASISQAFSLFGGSAKSDAVSAIRKADKMLSRADSAYDGGNPDQALELYRKALGVYERVEADFPGIEDGIAVYRMSYCNDQIEQITGASGKPGAVAAGKAPPLLPGTPPTPAASGDSFDAAIAAARATPGAFQDDGGDFPADAAEGFGAISPATIAALLAEARESLEDGRIDDAAAAAIDILRSDPQNREGRLLMGVIRTRQQRFDEARVALEDLQAEEEDEAVLVALAGVYQAIGDTGHALLALDKAIRMNPARPAPFLNMAWLMLSAGDTAAAEANYREAVRLGAKRDRQIERRLGL